MRKAYERRRFLRKAITFLGGLLLLPGIAKGENILLAGKAVWASSVKGTPGKASRAEVSMKAAHAFPSCRLQDEQAKLLTALVIMIFPLDGNGPCASDIGVAESLVGSANASVERCRFYSEGLAHLDEMSEKLYATAFLELQRDRQQEMLGYLDHIKSQMDQAPNALKDRILRKLRFLYYNWRGARQAADFWLTLQHDSMAVYYSHDVTWKWLGYGGPPFPNGYANDLKV